MRIFRRKLFARHGFSIPLDGVGLSPILVNVPMLMVTYGVMGGFGLGLIYLLYQWMYLCWCHIRSYGRVWTRANLSPISVNVPMLMVTYGVMGGFGLGLIYLQYQWMYLCWWLHTELWEGLVWTRTNLSPISVNASMMMVTYGVIGWFGLGLI